MSEFDRGHGPLSSTLSAGLSRIVLLIWAWWKAFIREKQDTLRLQIILLNHAVNHKIVPD